MTTSKKTTDQDLTLALEEAIAAKPSDAKVHVSLRLDGDIYMELKRRAREGEAGGQYQTLMNRILRESLFARGSKDRPVLQKSALKFLEAASKKAGYSPPDRNIAVAPAIKTASKKTKTSATKKVTGGKYDKRRE